MTSDAIWMTQEAHDKLREEWEYISGPLREIISAKIGRARDEGDLSENAGYHAAKDEQGQNELRIRRLKQILDNAVVGGVDEDSDVAHPGSTVTIAYDGDPDDTDTFLLGSREIMALDDSVETQVYSPQSPVGAAVLGHREGDEVSYEAPNGRAIHITVLKIEGFTA
ncbi:MAG: transcription elongation factor GreA [Propionibacteriaceae bacterium]|jgi:transcription elongation factor GreA|nr:transcription elongation factor GreA [Propionibacteriaceae bacterium]